MNWVLLQNSLLVSALATVAAVLLGLVAALWLAGLEKPWRLRWLVMSVVAGPGYDVYYLNFLAGSARALAVTEDPQHVWIRSTWKDTDPRLPLVRE